MSMRILNRSFSAGEITPELFGRLDLPKVQESLALCRNFITLPHGPVANRPGTEFVEEVKDSAHATRLIPFSYNNEQTFAIQVGAGYFRFHTQGGTLQCGTLPAYVPSATVTISLATPGVVTWSGHGLAANDPVSFETTGALPTGISAGVTYYVQNPTANTFELSTVPDGASLATSGTQSGTHTGSYAYDAGSAVSSGGVNYYCIQSHANQLPTNTAYWYAMPANGDYEVPNSYAAADVMDVHYTQSADVLTLTHPNYPIAELRRYGTTNWQLDTVHFSPVIAAPVGTTSSGSPTSHQYVVTAIIAHRRLAHSGGSHHWVTHTWESLPSAASASVACDLSLPDAYIKLSWAPLANATGYHVYKLVGGVYRYLGAGDGPGFIDTNATSARAGWREPPTINRYHLLVPPSAPTATPVNSTVGTLNAVATGGGTPAIPYSYVVTAVDSGGSESRPSSSASCNNNLSVAGTKNTVSWPSVDGALRYNVYKESYGIYGFIGQVARGTTSFEDDNITADVSRTPPLADANELEAPGDYPATVAYYQQRRVFAGSANQPQNVWATRSGTEADMTYTIPSRDDNRLAFRIAGREASAIRHVVPLQDLLFLSASCEWRCSSSTGVLTPATINVQPQSYVGANNVQPVVVGNAVLYAAARGGHIREMGYSWQINGYQSSDASIFAPHLFDYNTIVDMAYSRGPIPILWCVSSTGSLLGMTWLPEQKIAAWHQHDTGNGDAFESICTISENNEDMLYAIVRRTINGVTKRYVERLHTRLYATLADSHYVDCGVTYTAPVKSGTYASSGTTLSCTIAAHGLTTGQTYWFAFSDSSYGSAPGGQPYVVTVVDANTFSIEVTAAASTSGTITWLPHTCSGLNWLEGMTVNILADGAVLPQQVVTGGTVTFPVGVTTAHIGLPITAQIQTPPAAQSMDPAMAQGMAKNVNRVFLRTWRSSGILAGPDFDHLVPYRQRSTENPGSPPNMVSDEVEIVLDAAWGASGQVCIQQSDPLPLDIAAMTLEIATGGGV